MAQSPVECLQGPLFAKGDTVVFNEQKWTVGLITVRPDIVCGTCDSMHRFRYFITRVRVETDGAVIGKLVEEDDLC